MAAGAAMEAEKIRLLAWIEAPVLKPLAARGEAKARVMELGILISEQSAAIQSLRAELDVAEGVRALAAHIHDDCALEIAVAE